MVQIVGIVPSVPSGESRKDSKLPSLVVMWVNASMEALLRVRMEAPAPAAMDLLPEAWDYLPNICEAPTGGGPKEETPSVVVGVGASSRLKWAGTVLIII